MIRGFWVAGVRWTQPAPRVWAATLPCGTVAAVERRGREGVLYAVGNRGGFAEGEGVLELCGRLCREAKARAAATEAWP